MLNGSSKDMPSRKEEGGGAREVIQSYDTDFTTQADIYSYKRHCIAKHENPLSSSISTLGGGAFRQKTKLHSQYK